MRLMGCSQTTFTTLVGQWWFVGLGRRSRLGLAIWSTLRALRVRVLNPSAPQIALRFLSMSMMTGNNFVVRWPKPIRFTDGRMRSTMWFNVSGLGEAETRRQAWLYLMDAYCQAAVGLSPFRAGVPHNFGPVSEVADERGLVYHGRERRTSSVYSDLLPTTKRCLVVSWGPREDTFCAGREFLRELRSGDIPGRPCCLPL